MARQLYAGIDLGGTNIKYGLVDRHAKIVHSASTPTGIGRKKILNQFAKIAGELEQIAGENNSEVFTVGVGSPGIIDIHKGKVAGGSPNVPGWRGTEIKRSLERATGLEVCADNDANVMALAEHRFGAGKGFSSGLYVTVGTGLGSGIILNNSLWRGAWFAGAELGHSIIKLDGIPCQCGKQGCLEMYVNAASFAKYYGGKTPAGSGSKQIFDLAKAGDRKAAAAIKQSAEYLAIGLGSALEILNPEIVVIGGGVAAGGDLYLGTIRKRIAKYTSKAAVTGVKIVAAKLGNDAGMLGAALLPLEPEFSK
ncbi:MAG: ROK family protein [Candidatus Zixiibacteriota bacterium]